MNERTWLGTAWKWTLVRISQWISGWFLFFCSFKILFNLCLCCRRCTLEKCFHSLLRLFIYSCTFHPVIFEHCVVLAIGVANERYLHLLYLLREHAWAQHTFIDMAEEKHCGSRGTIKSAWNWNFVPLQRSRRRLCLEMALNVSIATNN